ncbi:MAG: OmpA family protein [Myxococcales bacterium]|nr:OmpA family protein [Myxococcales bacterium]
MAFAQDVQNFKPAVGTWNLLSVETASTAKAGLFVPSLYVNYGSNPLVRRDANDEITAKIVENLVGINVMGVIGLHDRFELGVDIPLGYADGEQLTAVLGGSEGFGLGDIRAIPKVRLLGGTRSDVLGLALSIPVSFPTGDTEKGFGADTIVVNPKLIIDLRMAGFTLALNGGFRFRQDDQVVDDLKVGNEINYGGGVAVDLGSERAQLLAEAFGAAPAEDLGSDIANSPLEANIGFRFFTQPGLVLTPAAGIGIIPDYGSPDFRVILGLAWHKLPSDDQCPDEEEDMDGFQDGDGCPDPDNDQDGILDVNDQCPNDPEDKDGFEDENGCPDPDNDQDGILDVNDQCPLDPEDKDGFEDENGCPDPDNDQDGLLDAQDKCPNEPEDKDDFQDHDGCPDPDNDQDGILDVDDKCPLQPENFNGVEDEDGCPDQGGGVTVTCKEIRINETVFFDTDKATIQKRSFGLLESVASALKNAKFITKVRVEGHTDSRADDDYNLDLSQRRSEAVKKYLVGKGIDAGRLEPKGFGESQPVAPNDTEANMSKNRRVVFVVLENETCKNAGGTGADQAPKAE